MPHIIVKLWPGKSEEQKQKLSNLMVLAVNESLGYGPEAVSVAMEEIAPGDWAEQVYRGDIQAHPERLTKQPGYQM